MSIRNDAKALYRGAVVAVVQTALLMVGVPLALLAMSLEWLAEQVGWMARAVARLSEDLSHWRREALLRDVKQKMRNE